MTTWRAWTTASSRTSAPCAPTGGGLRRGHHADRLFALGQGARACSPRGTCSSPPRPSSSCVFSMTIFAAAGTASGPWSNSRRAPGGANAADPKKLKVCGRATPPSRTSEPTRRETGGGGARAGDLRKPKLATREELDRSKAAGERASPYLPPGRRDTRRRRGEVERRQAVKQTKDLRRRHAGDQGGAGSCRPRGARGDRPAHRGGEAPR